MIFVGTLPRLLLEHSEEVRTADVERADHLLDVRQASRILLQQQPGPADDRLQPRDWPLGRGRADDRTIRWADPDRD